MEGKMVGVEEMPVKERAALAVQRVPHQRMPQVRQVHPHLVSPAGIQI